ncbi:MAG: 50S ribosomal protein L25 [Chlamydiia bacterium]|nr:50S ribosomal protein L25 [Chlamydiia bacterium]
MSLSLKIESRNDSKMNTNQLRRSGFIPAIMYYAEKGTVGTKVSVPSKEFISILNSINENSLGSSVIEVILDDSKYNVVVKGIQHGLVTYPVDVRHLDLMIVEDDSNVKVRVPVVLKNDLPGECIGLQAGGVVRKNIKTVILAGKLKEIPKSIIADVKDCNIGDSIFVGECIKEFNVKLVTIPKHEAIATVDKKRAG